jgi:hyperosmotically inducible periplasmic protein
MNGGMQVTRATKWISGAVCAAVLGCVVAAQAITSPPDAWITTKIKLLLLTTEGITATAVNVDTVNGQVTLHGKVGSADEKEKAETVVRKIDGVQGVRNLLQIVAAKHEKAVQASDNDIEVHVKKALQAAPSLKDSSISVQSVNNGVVLLGGTAKTMMDHLSAVEVAASVPGVRRVASEIQSPDTLADAEIWRQSPLQLSSAPRGIGDAARDVWITSATKLRLLADKNTPALDINVDTRNGVVTLFGIVPSNQAMAAAEADARKVSGVQRVVNELQVVPSATQKIVKARDDVLQHEVKQAFENREDLKDINVQVKNCVARLSGTVPSGAQRLEAAVVARSTHGVCAVQDDLRISD